MKTFYILLLLTVFLGCTSQPDNVSPTEQEKIIDVSKQLAPFGIKVATPLLSKDYDEISYIVRGESFIEAGSGRSFSLNHARVSVRNLHDNNPSLQFLNEDELVTYRLSLNLFRNELVFYRNKEKLVSSDNIQKVKALSTSDRIVLAFLLANYVNLKKEDHLDRYANLEKRDSSERSGLRMPPPDGDGCKKTSFGVSLTKGDASASAAGSDPCGSEGGCSRSGDPGCVCATGIWGGEIACTCIQVWNCTGSVCCLPQ